MGVSAAVLGVGALLGGSYASRQARKAQQTATQNIPEPPPPAPVAGPQQNPAPAQAAERVRKRARGAGSRSGTMLVTGTDANALGAGGSFGGSTLLGS